MLRFGPLRIAVSDSRGLALKNFLANYRERHRHPVNLLLHIVGVPMTFVVSVIVLIQGHWTWALGAFFFGYVLQFIGHAVEGNDAGEVILVKRMLGMPYIEFGPQSESEHRTSKTGG